MSDSASVHSTDGAGVKTAVVERTLDRLIGETMGTSDRAERMAALLAQFDCIPERADTSHLLEWGEQGLPK